MRHWAPERQVNRSKNIIMSNVIYAQQNADIYKSVQTNYSYEGRLEKSIGKLHRQHVSWRYISGFVILYFWPGDHKTCQLHA